MTDSTEHMQILLYKAVVQIWKLVTFQLKVRLSVHSLWIYAKTQMGVHLALPALNQTWCRVHLEIVVLWPYEINRCATVVKELGKVRKDLLITVYAITCSVCIACQNKPLIIFALPCSQMDQQYGYNYICSLKVKWLVLQCSGTCVEQKLHLQAIDGYIKSLTVPCKNESYLVLVEDLASCDAYVSNSIHINMGGTKIE